MFHPFCELSCSFIAIFLTSISAFPWMLTGVEEERCLVRCRVHRVIVHKFCDGQPFLPIILEVVTINLEVYFDVLVDTFRLTISLWMVSGRGILFQPKEAEELLDVLGNKMRVVVVNDVMW